MIDGGRCSMVGRWDFCILGMTDVFYILTN